MRLSVLNTADGRGSFRIQGVEYAGFEELFKIHRIDPGIDFFIYLQRDAARAALSDAEAADQCDLVFKMVSGNGFLQQGNNLR